MHSRLIACASVLFGWMLLGYACKGGGGDGSVAFIEVLQTVPEDERIEVIPQTRIGFRIDGVIDPASLTGANFFMTDADGRIVPSGIAIASEPDSAELIPDQPLELLTRFTVTLTTDLRTTDGRTLEETFDWEFTTLDSEWGTSEWLEEVATGVSSQPQIAVDGQSNAIAVWEYTEDTGSGVWANRYTRSSLWGQPERISEGDAATSPQVAVDDFGNGFAVWAQREASTDANVWTNRYVVDEGWGEPELLQEGEVTPARIPSVAADPAGNAIAIWSQRDVQVAATEFVWARRFEAGSGWSPAESIDDDTMRGLTGTRTAVGVDDNGNAIALWARGSAQLWSNRYTAGSGWGAAVLINSNPPSAEVREQRLAVGPSGDAFVVWVERGETRDDIWGVRFSGSTWDEPERLDSFDAGDKKQPDIAVDGMGVAHAVWSQADPDFENIWANEYAAGSGWGAPQLVEPPNTDPLEDGDADGPRISANAAGNTFIVWRQVANDWPSVWSNRIDPGMNWNPANAELIEDIARTAKRAVIVVDDDRHAHAIWPHSAGPAADWVRTNRFE